MDLQDDKSLRFVYEKDIELDGLYSWDTEDI